MTHTIEGEPCHHHHHLHVHHHDHHLYRIDPEEKDIEAAIEGEPDQVQGEEVKVQTDHAEGSFGVFLWWLLKKIEGFDFRFLSPQYLLNLFRLKFSTI